MYFLIYRSIASSPMTEEGLVSLLAQSRDYNATVDITGMLLYFDNKFIQLLEGREEHVKQLYSSICADGRHKEISILKEGPAKERMFPGWSMSFRNVTSEEILDEPAYKDVYQPGSPGAMDLVSLFNLLRGKAAGQRKS